MKYVIETSRLRLRHITHDDFPELCKILQSIEVMYAWGHAFTDTEVMEWIEKNIERYKKDGYSYFLAIEKTNNQIVGLIGPLVEDIKSESHIGVAYILNKEHWHKGYALEGAKASIDYAFKTLGAKKVIAQIRPENINSRKVAEKLGMIIEGEYIKYYKGKEMSHLIYSIKKDTKI